jgi:anti-anti-sigma factor
MGLQARLIRAQSANLRGPRALKLSKVFAPEFEIAVTGGLTWARIAVLGELDIATSHQLGDALEREHASGRAVTLDLSGVEFLDSSGLTVVLRAMKDAQDNGWNFGIASTLSEPVLRTVRVAGVLPMLPLIEE